MSVLGRDFDELFKDSDFSNMLHDLKKLAPAVEKVKRGLKATRKPPETLAEKVTLMCAFARSGYLLHSVTGSPMSVKGLAPMQTPPVPTGIMHCVNELKRIVIDNYVERMPKDFEKIPSLVRRIRYLIRVFFDHKLTGRKSPDAVFCDFEKLFDVSITLHEIGLYFQRDPARLRSFMRIGGKDAEKLVLQEPLDLGKWRKMANKLDRQVRKDEEADDKDREEMGNITDRANEDLAAHAMVWFFADINVAFFFYESAENEWVEKSSQRLVKWSTSSYWRDALGDPLTDSMRPIYWDQKALVRFSHAGGLAALYGDWYMSSAKEACEKILLELPESAWEHQTKISLSAVTRELQNKVGLSRGVLTGSIFISACYNMYKRYGLAPFQVAAKHETFQTPVVFYFISHMIKKAGIEMKTKQDWRNLLEEFVHLSYSQERRYSWANYTISGKWDCLEYYGCDYKACPEKQALLKLREERQKGNRDPAVEERLDQWGAKARACSACSRTSYCGKTCQKAHWSTHKPDCRKDESKCS